VRRLSLAAGSVLAALAVAAASAAPPPPTVSIAARKPVVVAGAHFFPREWVRVTLNASTLRVHADRAGRFHLTFPDLILGRCAGLRIRAAGTHGTVAALKLPLPACMPARSP
jgi:hypothetical protein